MKNDPDELVNLAKDPKAAGVLKDMRKRTDAMVAKQGGPLEPLKGGFVASTVPHPEASAAVGTRPGPDGFVRIFNGKNLNGWTGDLKYWSVKDGAITGVTDGSLKMNRFITWNASTIQNFELQIKVKVSAQGNSGIQYRGTILPRWIWISSRDTNATSCRSLRIRMGCSMKSVDAEFLPILARR